MLGLHRVAPIGLLVILLSAACDDRHRVDIADVKRKVESLQRDLDQLRKAVSETRRDATRLRMDADRYRSAKFEPAFGKGFSRIDTSLGPFVVSVEDVQPFVDGVRLRLSIGNLTAATLSSGVLEVKWGKRRPSVDLPAAEFDKQYDTWERTLQKKSIPLTHDLYSGRWNVVTLTLPGVPLQEFGYFELSMSTDRISLTAPR